MPINSSTRFLMRSKFLNEFRNSRMTFRFPDRESLLRILSSPSPTTLMLYVFLVIVVGAIIYLILVTSGSGVPSSHPTGAIKKAVSQHDFGLVKSEIDHYVELYGTDDFSQLATLHLPHPGITYEDLDTSHTNAALFLLTAKTDNYQKLRLGTYFLENGITSWGIIQETLRAFIRLDIAPPETFFRELRRQNDSLLPPALEYWQAYQGEEPGFAALALRLHGNEYHFLRAYFEYKKGNISQASRECPSGFAWKAPKILKGVLRHLEYKTPIREPELAADLLYYFVSQGRSTKVITRSEWQDILPRLGTADIKKLLPLFCLYHEKDLLFMLYELRGVEIPELALAYGYVMEREGFQKEAYRYYAEFEKRKSSPLVYLSLARIDISRGRMDKALAWLDQTHARGKTPLLLRTLIKLFEKKDGPPPWRLLEHLAPLERSWVKAEWAFRKRKMNLARIGFSKLMGSDTPLRSASHSRLVDIALLEEDYERALELQTLDEGRSYRKLTTLWKSGRHADALGYFLNHPPRDAREFNLRGIIFAEIGNFDRAKSSFKKALSIDPADRKARVNLLLLEKK